MPCVHEEDFETGLAGCSSRRYPLSESSKGADMSEASEWLTTQETMVVLGISRTRLWQLVKEGRLTPYQRGANRKVRYYPRVEVDRLAAEQQPRLSRRQSEKGEEGD